MTAVDFSGAKNISGLYKNILMDEVVDRNFNTQNVTEAKELFKNCTQLRRIRFDGDDWETVKI